MNEAGERSKALVVRLGTLANKLTFFRYGVPQLVVAELVNLRKEMEGDAVLRDCGQIYHAMLNDLLSYADALNSGKRTLADGYMVQAVAKWDIVNKTLEKGGNGNGV